MKTLLVFGCSTSSGEYFLRRQDQLLNIFNRIYTLSRSPYSSIYVDLFSDLPFDWGFIDPNSDIYIISFAPLIPFVHFLDSQLRDSRLALRISLIVCLSSSSALSRRFSFSKQDKKLSSDLCSCQERLKIFCRNVKSSLTILQPAMIYGTSDNYSDKNISFLTRFMRLSPFIVMPRSAGLRQPIHCSQVADLIFHFLIKAINSDITTFEILPVGGDTTLSYTDLLKSIKTSCGVNDCSNFCLVITIPNRLFLLFSATLIPFSMRLFESLARVMVDLSGYASVSSILNCKPSIFPVVEVNNRRH